MSKAGKPVSVCMSLTHVVRATVTELKRHDCRVTEGSVAKGHVVVSDGDVRVYRALQKGRGGPWIALFFESDNVQWTPRWAARETEDS